jgi:putative addiction module killer protein
MIRIEEYVSKERSPFRQWFDGLDAQAASGVTVAIERLADGNVSNVKSIGEGAAELKINRGPGYRVYFGWDGQSLIILLGGGTKRRQRNDIDAALRCWRDYKARKRRER